MSRCTRLDNQWIFYNIKNFWLKLSMKINPGKNCAPVFLIANHEQFCNIFSTKYGVGYFFPQLVSAGIFFYSELPCRNFFSKSPPPPHQKLNGRPVRLCFNVLFQVLTTFSFFSKDLNCSYLVFSMSMVISTRTMWQHN